MGLVLLKWFGLYCLYVGIGAAFFALHIATMLKGRLCWLFWPDVDVKFISHRFVDENISAIFCCYIIFLWPFRFLQILIIFVARIGAFIIISFVTVFLLACDFFSRKEVMKVANDPHNQDGLKNTA